MKLSVLIVSWNTRDLLIQCVQSILDHAPKFEYEIIVVDNNSFDQSTDALREKFGGTKNLKIYAMKENLGFAKANNLAFRHSLGEYLFFLNPDTQVEKYALQNLLDYMEKHPNLGIAGPRLLNPDRTIQQSVRRFPDIWSSLLVFSGLHRFFRPHSYYMDRFDYQREAEVEQVMGAALMTRRSVVEKIGLFDENFWLWYEEVDFCKRVKDSGFSVKFFPGAEVIHHSASSFSQVNIYERKKIMARSLMYYFKKNGKIFDTFLILAILPLVLAEAWIIEHFMQIFRFKTRIHV